MCGGNPPDEPVGSGQETVSSEETADEDAEIVDLVNDIADIVAWQQAGFETDWSHYPFETKRLVQLWFSTMSEVAAIQNTRMQIFLKSWFKEK